MKHWMHTILAILILLACTLTFGPIAHADAPASNDAPAMKQVWPTQSLPVVERMEAPLVSPKEARKRITARVVPQRTKLTPEKKTTENAQVGVSQLDTADSSTPAPEISELARGLGHDPDLIYAYVHDFIEVEPLFGVQKGALGALLDKSAGPFDQALLMGELLKASGFEPEYVYGQIHLSPAQVRDWLGIDGNPDALTRLLGAGGIPATIYRADTTLIGVDMQHIWVKVAINGTDYVFDPSFKEYVTTRGIDLAQIMGFDAVTFLADAADGASSGPGWHMGLNRENVRGDLTTYAANLRSALASQYPNADFNEIIGRKSIQPVSGTLRQATLPYELIRDQIWAEIPEEYRIFLTVTFPNDYPNHEEIEAVFATEKIYGKRLTISYTDTYIPQLRLDGHLVIQSSGQWHLPQCCIARTFGFKLEYPLDFYSAESSVDIFSGKGVYSILTAFGRIGQEQIARHQQKYQEAIDQGLAETSEAAAGEKLAFVGAQYAWQFHRGDELVGRITDTAILHQHMIGVISYDDCYQNMWEASHITSMTVDIRLFKVSVVNRANNTQTERACVYSLFGRGSVLESGTIEQVLPANGASTVAMIDLAMSRGDKIFDVRSTSQFYDLKTNQSIIGYENGFGLETMAVYLAQGYRVILTQYRNMTMPEWIWQGTGYMGIKPDETGIGHMVTGNLKTQKGGILLKFLEDVLEKLKAFWDMLRHPDRDGPQSKDPISLKNGHYLLDTEDISVGGPSPMGLTFRRQYSSGDRRSDSGLGYGFSHNLDIRAALQSQPALSLGEDTAASAAPILAALIVLDRIYDLQGEIPLANILTGVATEAWYMEQLVNNTLSVGEPAARKRFVRQPDGSFVPTAGVDGSLVQEQDGTYLLTTKTGEQSVFNSDGTINQWHDTNGNTIDYSYENGNLQTVTNSFGHSLNLTWTDDRLSHVSDDTGRSVGFDYQGKLLTGVTDVMGRATTFAYDDAGRLTTITYPTAPANPFVTNVYDDFDRVKEQTNAAGKTYSFAYTGYRTTETDPLGQKRVWLFDERSRNTAIIQPNGDTVTMAYDGQDRLAQTTYPEGNAEERSYDVNHNLVQILERSKSGSETLTTSMTYHPTWNKPTSITDPLSRTTDLAYDAAGNLTQVEQPLVDGQRPTRSMTYAAHGLPQTVTAPDGMVTRFTWTDTGEVQSVTVDNGRKNLQTSFTYTERGDPETVTDPLGRVTTNTYDNARHLTQVTAPSPYGYLTQLEYDAAGRPVRVKRETRIAGQPWQIVTRTFTADDRLASVIPPEGGATVHAYDDAGRLWTTADGEGRVVEIVRDGSGREVERRDGQGLVISQTTYTANGKVASLTDGNGNQTTFTYDGFDRLQRITYPDQSYEAFTYDAAGNLLTSRPRAGQIIENGYDALNRLRTMTIPGAPSKSFAYDLAGRLVDATDTVGASLHRTYDTAGRLQSVTDNGYTMGYLHDAVGNLTKLIYPDGSYVDYIYDTLNRLDEIRDQSGALIAGYGYDTLSRRTTLAYANGASTTTSWTLADKTAGINLTFADASASLGYGYDLSGKQNAFTASDGRLAPWWPSALASFSANDMNQYTSVSGVVPTYDANGNLTGLGAAEYAYDALNRLTAAPSAGATYAYDPLDRRSAKTVAGVTTHFVYDRQRVVAEYDGAGQLLRKYVFALGLDEPVRMTGGGTDHYYHADALGSVVALSDAAGNLAETYRYTPYGRVQTPSSLGNRFLYTGREFDAETGLYHYRARVYDAASLRRFLQPDPLRYAPGMNVYAYVLNDPINFVDPNGEYLTIVGGIVGGGAAGFMTGLVMGGLSSWMTGGSWNGIIQSALVGAFIGGAIGGVAGGYAGAGLIGPLGLLASDFWLGFANGVGYGEDRALASYLGTLAGALAGIFIDPEPANGRK